jgi:hypothetical protein
LTLQVTGQFLNALEPYPFAGVRVFQAEAPTRVAVSRLIGFLPERHNQAVIT